MLKRVISLAAVVSVSASGLVAQARYVRPGSVSLVSVGSRGERTPPTSRSHAVDVSGSGRFVVFDSTANGLTDSVAASVAPVNLWSNVFLRDLRTGKTELISRGIDGTPAAGVEGSYGSSISNDGRYVLFSSDAPNLVQGDTNLIAPDLFAFDRLTEKIQRIPMGRRVPAEISGDGRWIAFSTEEALLPEDENGQDDVYVITRENDTIELISVGEDGTAGEGDSFSPSISVDGRFIAFNSSASDLGPDGKQVIGSASYVRDRKRDVTELVSVSSQGERAVAGASVSDISDNGRFVVLASSSPDLIPHKGNGPITIDVFLHDRQTGRTERVSVSPYGEELSAGTRGFMRISGNGRFVTFINNTDVLPEDRADGPADDWDLYVHDRLDGSLDLVTRAAEPIEPAPGQAPSQSDLSLAAPMNRDGSSVIFSSERSNHIAGDENAALDVFLFERGTALGTSVDGTSLGLRPRVHPGGRWVIRTGDDVRDIPVSALAGADIVSATAALRPLTSDLYLRIDVDEMGPFVPRLSDPFITFGFRFTLEGTSYEVRAQPSWGGSNLDGGAVFKLFLCSEDDTCDRELARLRGGYGTVGDAVVTAVPLAALDLSSGGHLTDLTAFTAPGASLEGTRFLDRLRVR